MLNECLTQPYDHFVYDRTLPYKEGLIQHSQAIHSHRVILYSQLQSLCLWQVIHSLLLELSSKICRVPK